VQALTAGYHFQPSEEEVEGVRAFGSGRIRKGIKRTLHQRVADDEQELGPVLPSCPVAEPALVARRQVRLADEVFTEKSLWMPLALAMGRKKARQHSCRNLE
jgi:hypothetical protein